MQQVSKLSGLIVSIAVLVSLTSCNGASSGSSSGSATSDVLTQSCLSAGVEYVSQSEIPSVVVRNNCDVKEKLSDVTFKLLSNSSIAKNAKFTAANGDVLDFSKTANGSLATISVAKIDSIPAGASIRFDGLKTSATTAAEKLETNIVDAGDVVAVVKTSDLGKVPSSGGVFITDIPNDPTKLHYNSTIRSIPPGQFGLKGIQITNKYNNNVTIKLNSVLPKGISYSYAYASPTDPTRTTCIGAGAVLKPNQSCNVVFKFEPTKQGINDNFNYSVQVQAGSSTKLLSSINNITVNYSSRTYLYFTEGNTSSFNQSDVQACQILAGGIIDSGTCITTLGTNNSETYIVMAEENGLLYATTENGGNNYLDNIQSCNISYTTGTLTNCQNSTSNQAGLGGMTVFGGYAYVTTPWNGGTPQLLKCLLNSNGSVNMGACNAVNGASLGSAFGALGGIFMSNNVAYLTPAANDGGNFLPCTFSSSGISCGSQQNGTPNGINAVTFFKNYVYFADAGGQGLEQCTFDPKNGVATGSCKQMVVKSGGTSLFPSAAYVFGEHMYVYNGTIYQCDLDASGEVNGSCNVVQVNNNSGLSTMGIRVLHPLD